MLDASRAKAAGDRAGQQAAGQEIRKIKGEIGQYSLSDTEVEEARAALRALAIADEGSGGADEAAKQCEAGEADGPTTAASPEPRSEEKEDDSPFDAASLFDADGGIQALESAGPPPPRTGPPARLLARLQKRDAPVAPGKKSAGKRKEAVVLELTPKQVLTKFCHARGLPAPRFEKLPVGGGRNGSGGFRYSVTTHEVVPSKGAKRASQARVVALPPQEDGWSSIEEAQHAVATRALHLFTPEEEGLWQQLPKKYQELWFAWVDEEERAQQRWGLLFGREGGERGGRMMALGAKMRPRRKSRDFMMHYSAPHTQPGAC